MAGKRTKESGEETSAQTFVRLAKGRTSKAIRQMRTLRSLNNYESTATQRRKIVDALAAEVKAIEDALNAPAGSNKAADLFDF